MLGVYFLLHIISHPISCQVGNCAMELASFVSFPSRSQDLYESLANAVQDDRAYSILKPEVREAVGPAVEDVSIRGLYNREAVLIDVLKCPLDCFVGMTSCLGTKCKLCFRF